MLSLLLRLGLNNKGELDLRLEHSKILMGLSLATTLVPYTAYCEVYLSEEAAVKSIFPKGQLTKKVLELSPEEVKTIEDTSGEKVRNSKPVVWVGSGKSAVFIDQVLGKHEFITIAAGITAGQVQGIEVMEYRETYGQQVRGSAWRKQFVGKNLSSPLKLNQDIVNISGATLSSAHITAGVRRLLRTYEIISSRL
jgi:Na+-translocating ferredoxin:NAD+ oxidoreductase RnfG subunit